jgi:RecA-family ATPase
VNLGADHPIISRRASDRAARAVAEGEAETRSQAKVAERAARQLAGDDVSPIDAFNDRHDVAELLARYGYAQLRGSSDWRSPYQTSGSFATRCFGDHWVSLSASDSAADIGAPSKSGARFGDAFDLFCHFEHGGTTAIAVAAYGAEMRQSDPPHVGSDAGWTPQDETGEAETPPPHPDEFYAGSADGAGTVASGGSGKSSRKVAFFPASDLDGQTVPVRQWLVLDLIPSGTVTMLGGDGGTGKSLLALQLAASVAHGGFPWLGHHPERGTAVFLSAEDDRDELHRRVADVARAEGVSLAEMRDLHLLSLAGEDALLATLGPDGSINRTALANAVESYLVKHPSQLMVLDTLADLYPGNENDRAQARQFIGLCRGIAIRQNCAILLLSHPSLSGLNSGAGTSGSTAWNNSVRSRLYLERVIQDGYEPNPDARVMTAKKANYGRTGGEINMTWQDGVFVAEQVATGLDRVAASMKSERVFLKLLRLFTEQGRRVNAGGGQTYAPSVFSAHPDSEGINKRAFRSAMEGLLPHILQVSR